MSRSVSHRIRRVAGLVSIAAAVSTGFGITADAGVGPVCEDNEEPVCEEPPPPPAPVSPPRGFITIINEPFPEFVGVTFRLVLV